MPADELEAVRRSLAELGALPLPAAVAERLEARLAGELHPAPLAGRRARRGRVRIGAALSAAAAVAAIAVFALGWGGGGHPPVGVQDAALQSTAAAAGADSTAKIAAAASEARPSAPAKRCPPASRTGGGRPRAACPGARGGHARAV